MQQKLGQLGQVDFFDNKDGLNLSDSQFKIKDSQATSGQNYIYTQTGGIRKRQGHPKINSTPDTQLKTLGLAQNNTSTGTKSNIRGAGTKLQSVDITTNVFTNLSEDTLAAATNVLSSTSTVPMVFSQFNTSINNILWTCGAGSASLIGAYSSSKYTQNGSVPPSGTITPTVNAAGTGTFVTPGVYRWAIALRKTSTQALSNVAVEFTATLANATDTVTIPLTALTAIDTTKYDQIYLYRSAVAGVTGFTTGSLVAQIASTATTYTDTGLTIADAQNIPRAGNTILDNSVLPTGTYQCLTTFKRRLITASGSTVYASDLNKPESWPIGNRLQVPSGGPITSLSIVSFTSPGSNTIDEILVIHKETEMWVITGQGDLTDLTTVALKFISKTGAPNQTSVVSANGYLFWINYEQVYLWSGTGKPLECARLIKPFFYQDGDIDKTKLTSCVGAYYKKFDSVIWFLSHKIYGEQKFQLTLDLRLTMPAVNTTLGGQSIDGVFIPNNTSFPVYAAASYLPTSPEELLIMGDASGYLYKGYQAESDAGGPISFNYATRSLDCGNPNEDKRFSYIIVWVEELGTWNLTLDWWTDYKSADAQKSTRALPISTVESNAASIWDVAQWDVASWDDYNSKLKPLYFELSSDALNNSEGKSIRLQFGQQGADQPVTISGFSVIYTHKGTQKAAA